MLWSFSLRWSTSASQVCNRLSAGPPVLCGGGQDTLQSIATVLPLIAFAGAIVLLGCRFRAACLLDLASRSPFDRSATYFDRGFQ